ncbi:MAG TPA: type II toxin-antitoxin system PemK/MazF family toxin [Planctomycetaceae bacterium]|nr:type II toxin-antitoxin system PemK/MazF family toxin [Planctomycetaceae bacterium]
MIDVATPGGQQSGLLFTSAVQCENLLTVDCQYVLRRIGKLPADVMVQVNDCLKSALALP